MCETEERGRQMNDAVPMTQKQLNRMFSEGMKTCGRHRRSAAVFLPILQKEDGLHVLFEVRASQLAVQPGEVCFPGGSIEENETPRQAAVRETCEELLVHPGQVDLRAEIPEFVGPGGLPLYAYYGFLYGYGETWSSDEVSRVFTVPLAWFLEHEPETYRGRMVMNTPDDLPWDLIPGGKNYAWRDLRFELPFYRDTHPLIWGMTARVMHTFVKIFSQKGA